MRKRTTIAAIGFVLAAMTAQEAFLSTGSPAIGAGGSPRSFKSRAAEPSPSQELAFGAIPPGHWAFDELARLTGDPEIAEYLKRKKSGEKGVLKYNFAVIIAKFLTQSNNTEPSEVIKTLGPERLVALKRLVPLVRDELANLDIDPAALDETIDASVETGPGVMRDMALSSDGGGGGEGADAGMPRLHATGPAGGIAVLAARKGLYSDISSLKITPNVLKLKAGENKSLKAFGITLDNRIRPMRAVWELRGPVGELGPDGAFRATRAGSGVIRVYIPGTNLESNAVVHVVPGDLAKVVLRPGDGTLKPGQSVDFTAMAADSYGNEVPMDPVWKCVGKSGKMVGSTLVAMTEGKVKVYASTADGKAFDVAVIDVVAGQAPKAGRELREIEELKRAATEANAPALGQKQPGPSLVSAASLEAKPSAPSSGPAAAPASAGKSGSAEVDTDRARLSEDLRRLKAKLLANRARLSSVLNGNEATPVTPEKAEAPSDAGAAGKEARGAGQAIMTAGEKYGAGKGTTAGGWKYSVTAAKPDQAKDRQPQDRGEAPSTASQREIGHEDSGSAAPGGPVPGNKAPSVLIFEEKGKNGQEVRMFSLKNTTPEEIATAIESNVFGDSAAIKHQVDGRTNSMVISGRREVLETIAKYIEMADVPTPQVRIEARIIEVTLTESEGMGVDWSMLLPSKGSAKPVAEENSISVPLPGPAGEGATKLRFGTLSQEQFTAMLSVLSSRDRVKLVSNPSITTLNRKLASILVGQVVPIAKFSMNDYNGNYEVIGYEEKKIGINLEVTPSVTSSGTINLKVVPKVEDILGYVGQFKERPVTFTRSAETEVAISDNETLVIGGLIRETREKKVSKVPVLGDIPGIRNLFRRTLQTREKKETIIFITPRLVEREFGKRI